MHAGLLAFGHLGADPIAGLKTMDALLAHEKATRKAVFEGACATVTSASCGDCQDWAIPVVDLIDAVPTQAASRAWVLGISSRLRLNLVRPPEPVSTGKPVALSALNSAQRVALTAAASCSGALACAWILFRRAEWPLRNTSSGWLPLRSAGWAGERQVRDSIRAALASGVDVFDLQRHVGRATIGAGAVPLLQQVLTHFIACEFTLLVLDAGYLRVVQGLGIEAHHSWLRARDRGLSRVSLHPVDGGVDPMLQRGRVTQPSRRVLLRKRGAR